MQARRLKLKLAVVLLSAVCGLGLAELGMRLWLPQRYEPERLHSIVYFHPTRGFGFLPGTRFESEGQAYSINAQGFRDADFGPLKGKPDALRIAFLGDSFVEGLGLSSEQSLPEQLETRLRESLPGRTVEVYNCGVRAGSPAYYRLWLEDLAAYRPRWVIVSIFDNDLAEDAQAEIDAARVAALWLLLVPERLRSLHLLHVPARIAAAWTRSRPNALLDRIGGRTGALKEEGPIHPHYRFYHQTERWEPAWQNSRGNLEALLDRIEALGSRPLVVYLPLLCTLPNRPCYQKFFGEHPFRLPLREWLASFCAERRQPWLDAYPLLLRRDEEGLRSFLLDGHLNAEGAAAVADELLPLVRQAEAPSNQPMAP